MRRAERQIRAVWSPHGRDLSAAGTGPPRLVLCQDGVAQEQNRAPTSASPRRVANIKVVLLRTYLCLMAAAQKAWDENGGDANPDNPADPYMTLLGYFGSLRELGGSRRIVEDEVRTRLSDYHLRRRREHEASNLFAKRTRWSEPRELTSRVPTNEVAKTKDDLKLHFRKRAVDVALATNMISVVWTSRGSV